MNRTAPLRLMLVGPLPPPAGGMANQVLQLAELWRAEGLTVQIAQVNRPYTPMWIAHIPFLRAGLRLVPYLVSLWTGAGRADLVHIFANSGWSWHLFAAPAVWIASLRGTPVIVNYRGGEAGAFLDRSFNRVRPTLARAAAVVVPSGFLEGVFQRFGVPTSIVPNIINLSRFAPAAREPGNAPHLLVTRHLEAIYDIGTALRAFAIVKQTYPSATMTIAGSGPERANLQALANELGIATQVDFCGAVDNQHMPALYQRADLMLNPSTADNMPISVLEALASGVAVVSTNVGGVPYLVRDEETARLVPVGDHAAMARAVLELLSDTPQRQRLRANGIEHVKQFAWPRVRERWLSVYEEALAGSRGTATSRAAHR